MPKGKKTGGRTKGTPNKGTAEIKTLAQQYSAEAMAELARLAINAESEQARVSAIKELFDRGYGRAAQAVEISGPDGGALIVEHRNRIAAEIKSLMNEDAPALPAPAVPEQ